MTIFALPMAFALMQDWPRYASDAGSSKYSDLNQIKPSNLKKLKVLWRWTSPDQELLKENSRLFTFINEATPIAVNGFLYVSTSMSQVVKIDGTTGKTIWKYDPKTYKNVTPPNNGYVHRGVTYWKSADGRQERIFIGTGDAYLISIDARTGKVDANFGNRGRVDLLNGIDEDGAHWPFRLQYGVSSPVTVCNNTLVVGSSNQDLTFIKKSVRGDVRGFDPLTGQMKWRFHTIPKEGEFGFDTWGMGSAKYTGNTNVWTLMSADEKNGLVYLPVSTPTNDWFGGLRPGDNLFGESLVCLSCETGLRKWHFQFVHHGLWDYDPPAAPNLFETVVNGKAISAVAQVTKQGFIYTFDRLTGRPIWEIQERPVPQSHLEVTSLTQPFPTKPAAFDRQGIRPEDFLSPEAEKIADQYVQGPLYTPGTDQKKGTLVLPGWIGGGSWAGAAVSPKSKILYVSSITNPITILLKKSILGGYLRDLSTIGVTDFDGKPYSLPLFKPPYGRITAIDMTTGEFVWQKPLGKGPKEEPAVAAALKNTEWENQDLGWPRRGHLLITDEILFAAQSGDTFVTGISPLFNAVIANVKETSGEQTLKALNPKTGETLGEISLARAGASGNAYGALMTFMNRKGQQIIMIPVGGANLPAELLAVGIQED